MKRFKNILCVVNTEKESTPLLERAITLAENNQASLSVVDVSERGATGIEMLQHDPLSVELKTAMINTHQQALETLIAPYRKRIEIQASVLTGVPFLQIVRHVLRNNHDLVIKAPDTRDWLDRLFGSDDMHLLRKCPCPLWLIKPDAPKSYRRILAAVDVSDTCTEEEEEPRRALNRQILEMASTLALSDFAELHIVHTWEAIGEKTLRGPFMHTSDEDIATYINQVKQQHAANLNALINDVTGHLGQGSVKYLKPKKHLVKGWARKEIPALAKQIDAELIVMGTVARSGIPGFIMGNTAETILNQIDCSVLAIKPPGFVTPVTLVD